MFCVKNELTMPAWLYEAVLDELDFSYRERKRGGRSARTGAVQDHWGRKHRIRHRMMRTVLDQQAWELDHGLRQTPPNKDEAAKEVERFLRQSASFARGSSIAIEESFNRLENKED
jgi:TATA-binding protein-associated factor Taf7